jgi:hypothetical protein
LHLLRRIKSKADDRHGDIKPFAFVKSALASSLALLKQQDRAVKPARAISGSKTPIEQFYSTPSKKNLTNKGLV